MNNRFTNYFLIVQSICVIKYSDRLIYILIIEVYEYFVNINVIIFYFYID